MNFFFGEKNRVHIPQVRPTLRRQRRSATEDINIITQYYNEQRYRYIMLFLLLIMIIISIIIIIMNSKLTAIPIISHR